MNPSCSSLTLPILLMAVLPNLAAQDAKGPAKQDLRAFFSINCAVCHGADGSARGADGSRLKGQDFTNAKEMKDFTDAELAKTIRKGKIFGRMPSFKDRLSEAEIMEFVQQIIRKAEKGKVIAPETPAK
ncbi:MAG: cytochrome c [Acidobacteriota bacterium]|nr:cytochrome c [Acidobacteriota bacterium]